jgi:hypothetical protein
MHIIEELEAHDGAELHPWTPVAANTKLSKRATSERLF